jgi:hypothetical protein
MFWVLLLIGVGVAESRGGTFRSGYERYIRGDMSAHELEKERERSFCNKAHTKESLLAYVRAHPIIHIYSTCAPQRLPIKCSQQRDQDTRLIDIFFFVNEIDTLEMRLWELDDIVDEYVIIESDQDHHGFPNIPLIDALLQTDSRFTRFKHKVRTILIHQEHHSHVGNTDWSHERIKEKEGARIAREYKSSDIIIFGHVDEIPARSTMWSVKQCAEIQLPLNVGIWMPFGYVNRAFRTDWPARNHPYTLGEPFVGRPNTVVGLALGKKHNYVLGGFHASNYCYPPAILLKEMTATEYGGSRNFNNLGPGCIETMMTKCNSQLSHRKTDVHNINAQIAVLPWMLKCNPSRYSSWFGQVDMRLNTI